MRRNIFAILLISVSFFSFIGCVGEGVSDYPDDVSEVTLEGRWQLVCVDGEYQNYIYNPQYWVFMNEGKCLIQNAEKAYDADYLRMGKDLEIKIRKNDKNILLNGVISKLPNKTYIYIQYNCECYSESGCSSMQFIFKKIE